VTLSVKSGVVMSELESRTLPSCVFEMYKYLLLHEDVMDNEAQDHYWECVEHFYKLIKAQMEDGDEQD